MSNPVQSKMHAEPRPGSGESEGQLLLRHRDGDRGAFAELVAGYRASVYGYLARCGVRPDDRDDLFQEIFIRIHRSAFRYQAERPLHPWIFTIVANAVRNHRRKRRLRGLLRPDPPGRERAASNANGENVAVANQLSRWLEREIARLPVAQREALILTRVEKLSQQEAAEVLRIPVNTVKTHLRRARLALVDRWRRRCSIRGVREVSS